MKVFFPHTKASNFTEFVTLHARRQEEEDIALDSGTPSTKNAPLVYVYDLVCFAFRNLVVLSFSG